MRHQTWGASTSQGWIFGDWLKNYSGGLVGRGLSGKAFLLIPMESNLWRSTIAILQMALLLTLVTIAVALYFNTG